MRRDFVAGEIAAGRNPADALRALVAAPALTLTVERWAERFVASRIDVDMNTTKNYRTALRKAGETFGDRDPRSITVPEVADWVAANSPRATSQAPSVSTCSRSGSCSTRAGRSRIPREIRA